MKTDRIVGGLCENDGSSPEQIYIYIYIYNKMKMEILRFEIMKTDRASARAGWRWWYEAQRRTCRYKHHDTVWYHVITITINGNTIISQYFHHIFARISNWSTLKQIMALIPVSVKQTLPLHEPWRCNPAAETALRPLIWCF